MQVLTVENVSPSKSGKALRVKAGGNWYGAKKDSGITAGATIEAEVEDGEFGLWINKWKPANGSAAPQGSASESAAAGTSRGPTQGQSKDREHAAAAPVWGNFVSNQVAHAIQAGLITDPTHIKVWAAAAKQAFTELA